MKKLFILFILLLTQPLLASDSVLCQKDSPDKWIQFHNKIVSRNSPNLIVLSWNMLKFKRENAFQDLVDLSQNADFVFLQESMHNSNYQDKFTDRTEMDWTFYKSFCQNTSATGVQIGSRYSQSDVFTLIAPGTEPIVNTPKVTGFSKVLINEKWILLVSIHGLNANDGRNFEKQIDQVKNEIKKFEGPVIWAGDFNSWSPGRIKYLEKAAADMGLTLLVPDLDKRKLKLDHILVRGFSVNKVEVLDTYQSSDHWPIRAEIQML